MAKQCISIRTAVSTSSNVMGAGSIRTGPPTLLPHRLFLDGRHSSDSRDATGWLWLQKRRIKAGDVAIFQPQPTGAEILGEMCTSAGSRDEQHVGAQGQ